MDDFQENWESTQQAIMAEQSMQWYISVLEEVCKRHGILADEISKVSDEMERAKEDRKREQDRQWIRMRGYR